MESAPVQQLIERECGLHLHVRSVGKYLMRWGHAAEADPVRLRAIPAGGEGLAR